MDVRGSPPDAEVVALVLAGDTEAFGIVIRRYEAGLLRFATRMLGSRDAAADAVAESLVRAYRHLASCREPTRLRTWLYRIVTNRCKRDRKSTRLNSSHYQPSRMPSSA